MPMSPHVVSSRQEFSTKILYAFLTFHTCYMSRPSQSPHLTRSTNHEAPSYPVLSKPPVTSTVPHLDTDILPRTVFHNSPNMLPHLG